MWDINRIQHHMLPKPLRKSGRPRRTLCAAHMGSLSVPVFLNILGAAYKYKPEPERTKKDR